MAKLERLVITRKLTDNSRDTNDFEDYDEAIKFLEDCQNEEDK